MKSIKLIVVEQRQQAQEDICCILSGLDAQYIDRVCQMIFDRFNII